MNSPVSSAFRMKLYALVALSLLISCTLSSHARTPAAAAFSRSTSAAMFLIDSVTGLDMLDYYRSGLDRSSSTITGGTAKITDETPMSLKFILGESTRYQIALLPAKSDTIIAVIETLASVIPDSRIEFFDMSWKPVTRPERIFKVPSLADWLSPDGSKNRADAESAVPFLFTSYDYNPDSGILTLTDNTLDYFVGEDRDKIGPMLRQSLSFRWDGSKFVAVK